MHIIIFFFLENDKNITFLVNICWTAKKNEFWDKNPKTAWKSNIRQLKERFFKISN